MDFRRVSQEERERLYNEVWTDPVTTVAKRYNMSDNGLRKHCRRLWIPLPSSGYWAKVKAGQKISIPDLPKVRGELKNYVYSYVIKYRSDIDKLTDDELKSSEDLCFLTDDTISYLNETCSKIQVKSQLKNPHKLIVEHEEESSYRIKRDKELQQASFNADYYNITMKKYRENKAMLPINASGENLIRAYKILDSLICAIENMEGWTKVLLNSGKDQAYFSLMNTEFYFEINEEKPKKKQTQNDEIASYLVLSLYTRDWYYKDIQYSLEYRDNKNEPLENQVGNIILGMFQTANKMCIKKALKERDFDRKMKEEERQQLLEQMRNGELEELEMLEQAVSDWNKAQRIRDFTEHMESQINEVNDEEKREELIKWLEWAKSKADWLDPLTAKEDELLGKSKHIFEIIIEDE